MMMMPVERIDGSCRELTRVGGRVEKNRGKLKEAGEN